MMKSASEQNINSTYTPRTPLLSHEAPPKSCGRSFVNVLTSIFTAPERAVGWTIKKFVHFGESKGLGLRAAKIALVATSFGIVGESGLMVVRQISSGPQLVDVVTVLPGRLIFATTTIVSLVMCLPLNSKTGCFRPLENNLGAFIRQNSDLMLRSNLLSFLFMSCVEVPILLEISNSSRGVVYQLCSVAIAGIASILLSGGMFELIKHENENANRAPI